MDITDLPLPRDAAAEEREAEAAFAAPWPVSGIEGLVDAVRCPLCAPTNGARAIGATARQMATSNVSVGIR